MPALSRPCRSRKEGREENVMQKNALLVLVIEFEGAAVARLDRPTLGQQDGLAGIEGE
jgi:hypothetical protein